MKIESRKEDNILIVTVSGRLDTNTTGQFDQALSGLMADGKNLVIDLAELEYISSAGLRSILIAAKKIKENKGKMALSSLTQMVKEVFDMSGFSKIVSIYPDVPAACTQM